MKKENPDLTIRKEFMQEILCFLDKQIEKAVTDGEKELLYIIAKTIKDEIEFFD